MRYGRDLDAKTMEMSRVEELCVCVYTYICIYNKVEIL